MEKIGIDVHKQSTQICTLTEEGEYEERRIRTEPAALDGYFADRGPARILLEAATESEWVARHLESLGHEVIVADPNFAPMYATRSRKIKTDKRDARTLCDACELGAYRKAHRSSEASRLLRKHLAVREVLVQTRSRTISLCRSLLRQDGVRVPTGSSTSFGKRVRALQLDPELLEAVEPLLQTHAELCDKIRLADKYIEQHLEQDERAHKLTSVPSVGPVTATTFAAVLDDPERFGSAKEFCAYAGLVPREHSSGERRQRGHITKAGNRRLRSLLVECAWGILRRKHPDADVMRDWALRIALRRGKRIAAVALARKLAAILFAMTRDNNTFNAQLPAHAQQAAA
jgi:transposase